TIGVISAKGRNSLGLAEYEDFIQTDAAINPGNSGGPLLDIDGKAIGINTAIFSQSGGYSGIGFAIPINMAMAVKEQMLKNKGAVVRGFLGIKMQELTRDLAEMFGVIDAKGVLVAEVIPGSEAEKAGIKQGDIITAIDGAPVLSASDFRNRISLTPPSAELTLKVFRDRKEMAIKTRIGHEQPEPAEVAPPEN
ncbi:MAG: PDZ domain-containing protein, partial [Lentisphaerae bacterium]|nr:PDZ domain-containing protein [Lentisphaerota bacterium]